LEDIYAFHPLSIEDCTNINTLPKQEDYEEYLFLEANHITFTADDRFKAESLVMFVGSNYIVTYHRTPMPFIAFVKEKFNRRVGPIYRGPDRVAHALLDAMTDELLPTLADVRQELENLEDHLLDPNAPDDMEMLVHMRKELSGFRQMIRPQREIVYYLSRESSRFVRKKMIPYFRDVHDQLMAIEKDVTNYADQLLVSFDIYVNKTNQKTNEMIGVLTILTAITLPPMIIGSWFGMNFSNMPELQTKHGYMVAIFSTIASMIGIYVWFKKKKWIK
jgi:magnesium transporter